MAAPEGNRFAVGNNGGRPLIYETVEEIIPPINEYISQHLKETSEGSGQWVLSGSPTVTGLALHLGFSDKSTLHDYKKRQEFSHVIKRALLFIEHKYELMLETRAVTGGIFVLKNMGWVDETKIVQINHEAKKLTDEQIKELNEKLEDDY